MQQSMDEAAYAEARRILRTLFLGMDPENHHRLSTECVVMQPEVKTALGLGVEALQMAQWMRRSRASGLARRSGSTASSGGGAGDLDVELRKGPARAGQAWTAVEDERLRAAVRSGQGLADLSAVHGRSTEGLAARMVRLGLVVTKEATRQRLRRRA